MRLRLDRLPIQVSAVFRLANLLKDTASLVNIDAFLTTVGARLDVFIPLCFLGRLTTKAPLYFI